MLSRRRFAVLALGLPALGGCAQLLPPIGDDPSSADARALLEKSASSHGLAAFRRLNDLSVSYAGTWHSLVGSLQPALVDRGFRGTSEERLLLHEGFVAQSHVGPRGHKQVVRRSAPGTQGSVDVWFNGEAARDGDRRGAAALVADDYTLFLLGPMALLASWQAAHVRSMQRMGTERIRVNDQAFDCDILRIHLMPGLGLSDADDLALFIDRDRHLMRRVRFTVNGLESTRGAVAEVDLWGFVPQGGVLWPSHFHERLLRPFPLGVHDWQLTGLDVNRGLVAQDVDGPAFTGRAATPAAAFAH